MNNFLIVIDKEKGFTSRDVVNALSKILKIKKIGHTGTLDPIATGVLVCLTNKYTKLVPLITAYDKEYISTIKLGIKTDTLDITGKILKEEKDYNLKKEMIEETFKSLIGEYEMEVPIYSAKKVKGKKLYEYARNGEVVKLPKSEVIIKELELLDYHDDLISFRALVSKGTYIRSLIQVICANLGVIGVMASLRRIKQGNFKELDSYPLEKVQEGNFTKLKIEDILKVEVVNITKEDSCYKKIINGNKLNMNYKGYVLFKENGEEVALYEFNNKEGKLVIKIV